MYQSAQDAWQEVCLVLEAGSESGSESSSSGGDARGSAAACVVINRPLAKSMNRDLAELILNGASEERRGLPPMYSEDFVDKFVRAFGNEAAVYLGGPEEQGSAGLCVHGFDLPVRVPWLGLA